LDEKIDLQCQYYFELDELKAVIPDKFWNEERESERPFRDFLAIYKF
jgi:hypothetical protein